MIFGVSTFIELVYHRPPVKQSAIMRYMNRLEQQAARLEAWRESNKAYAAVSTYKHRRYVAPKLPKVPALQCLCRTGTPNFECPIMTPLEYSTLAALAEVPSSA